MAQIDALEKLASTGLLKHEPPGRDEIAGLVHSANIRLDDACKKTNAPESRFDLAYNAAHSLAVAALRIHGYRTDKRYIVFQALPQTLGVGAPTWRLLDRCHRERTAIEYEGRGSIDERLLTGLIEAALNLLARVRALARCAPSSPGNVLRSDLIENSRGISDAFLRIRRALRVAADDAPAVRVFHQVLRMRSSMPSFASHVLPVAHRTAVKNVRVCRMPHVLHGVRIDENAADEPLFTRTADLGDRPSDARSQGRAHEDGATQPNQAVRDHNPCVDRSRARGWRNVSKIPGGRLVAHTGFEPVLPP